MWRLGEEGAGPEWNTVETPFNISLNGVVQTVEGPYAAGARGHLVANRGDGWEVVFDDGPSTRDNQLRAIDATDDGERVWMLGSSGAMACYDVTERKKFDYSYPNEMTSTWEGITVSGERGAEKALASNGSGEVLPFTISGFDVDWGQLAKPAGKGSKMAALASTPDGVGFAVDTSGNAFKTTPDEGWTDIGIVNAQVKFYDIYAGRNQQVYVAAGDGRIYRYDDSYHDWTPIGVTDGTSLQAFDRYRSEDGVEEMVVLGSDGSIFQRTGAERWEKIPSPTKASLADLSLGKPDVAVGKGGTVIERPRDEPRNAGKSVDGDEFDGRGENYDADGTGQSEDPEGSADAEDGSDESDAAEPDGADDADGSETDGSDTDDADTGTPERDDPDDRDEADADSADEDASDEDTSQEDPADEDTAAEDPADEDTDAGVARWSSGTSSETSSSTSSETSSTTSTGSGSDTRSSVEVQADADSTDGGTSGTTDPQTKENVLVTIAERTDLEAVDVAEAAENGSSVVESVLVEIADDVGIDPQRVRDALNQPAE